MRSLMLASIALLTVGHAALAGSASYADDLREAVAEDYAAVEKHYKYFHANPELSYREEKSAKRIAKSLKSLGFSVQENIVFLGSAAMALLRFSRTGRGQPYWCAPIWMACHWKKKPASPMPVK